MNENKNWQNWQPVDKDLEGLLRPGFANKLQAHHPLMKLKRNLLINIIWSIVITLIYVLLIIIFPVWPVWLALAITSLFNIATVWPAIGFYREIQPEVSSSQGLLQQMKVQHHAISAWGKLQLRLALFVYPVATAGGYFLGGILGSGRTVDELLGQKLFVWVLPIAIIVLVPLSYLLAKWMFRKSFGRHLNALQNNIRSLEDLDGES